MICDRCQTAPAVVAVADEPENDGAMIFGDTLAGRVLCASCLALTERDGAWHHVDALDVAA